MSFNKALGIGLVSTAVLAGAVVTESVQADEIITQEDVDAVVVSNDALQTAHATAVEAHNNHVEVFAEKEAQVEAAGYAEYVAVENVEIPVDNTVAGYSNYVEEINAINEANQVEVDAYLAGVADVEAAKAENAKIEAENQAERARIASENAKIKEANDAEIARVNAENAKNLKAQQDAIAQNEQIKKDNEAERARVTAANKAIDEENAKNEADVKAHNAKVEADYKAAKEAYDKAVVDDAAKKAEIEAANKAEQDRVAKANAEGKAKVDAENKAALEAYEKALAEWEKSGVSEEDREAYEKALVTYNDARKKFEDGRDFVRHDSMKARVSMLYEGGQRTFYPSSKQSTENADWTEGRISTSQAYDDLMALYYYKDQINNGRQPAQDLSDHYNRTTRLGTSTIGWTLSYKPDNGVGVDPYDSALKGALPETAYNRTTLGMTSSPIAVYELKDVKVEHVIEDNDVYVRKFDFSDTPDVINGNAILGKLTSKIEGPVRYADIMTREEFEEILGDEAYTQILVLDGGYNGETLNGRNIGRSGAYNVPTSDLNAFMNQDTVKGNILKRYAVSLYDGSIYELSNSKIGMSGLVSPGEDGPISRQIVRRLTTGEGTVDLNELIRLTMPKTDGNSTETVGYRGYTTVTSNPLKSKADATSEKNGLRDTWYKIYGKVADYGTANKTSWDTETYGARYDSLISTDLKDVGYGGSETIKFTRTAPVEPEGEPDPATKPKTPTPKTWTDIVPNLQTYTPANLTEPQKAALREFIKKEYVKANLKSLVDVPGYTELKPELQEYLQFVAKELVSVPELALRTLKKVDAPAEPKLAEVPEVTKRTHFVDENGNELLPPVDSHENPAEIPGYEFVETKRDGEIITHVYRKVEPVKVPVSTPQVPKAPVATVAPAKPATPAPVVPAAQPTPAEAKVLPETGDAGNVTAVLGMAMSALGLTGVTKRRRK